MHKSLVFLLSAFLFLAGALLAVIYPTPANAQPEPPGPYRPEREAGNNQGPAKNPTSLTGDINNSEARLAPPPMSANPTQVEKGHYVYYLVCMACHGDRGQGLTDEWRAVYGPQDMDCWQSNCHGNNHPMQGFRLISADRILPVFGPNTLLRFRTAQDLHDYLVKTMPWWKPGYLKPEEYWELTAFLLDQRGVLPKGVILNEGNASVFLIRPSSPLPEDYRPLGWFTAAILVLTALVFYAQQRIH